MRRTFFKGLFVFFLAACAPFQDSPFSDQLFHSERGLNLKNVQRINDVEGDGKIRIAVFTDSHQNYKELDRVIFHINEILHIDFVVSLGDFTNSAYNFEYDQYLDHYLYIKSPALTVLGNHDAIGSGPDLYSKAFGPSNYYFESASMRYILFHSNNLEDPIRFDPEWLKQAVQSSAKPVIIFTHIPLTDGERFFGAVASTMNTVINHPNTKIIFNGHNHVYNFTTVGGTYLIQAPRVESMDWLLIEIQGNQLSVQRMGEGSAEGGTLKP